MIYLPEYRPNMKRVRQGKRCLHMKLVSMHSSKRLSNRQFSFCRLSSTFILFQYLINYIDHSDHRLYHIVYMKTHILWIGEIPWYRHFVCVRQPEESISISITRNVENLDSKSWSLSLLLPSLRGIGYLWTKWSRFVTKLETFFIWNIPYFALSTPLPRLPAFCDIIYP